MKGMMKGDAVVGVDLSGHGRGRHCKKLSSPRLGRDYRAVRRSVCLIFYFST